MSLGTIRAFQLDLARQIETLPAVFRFFDVAAAAGFNMCILYLEDRIKTASYPYSADIDSYSPAQIAEIVAYAGKLGLELVPVVSNLGHTERFLRHPQLAHLAELRGNIAGRFSKAGHASYNAVCPSLPETPAFFDRYITEVAALFPSPYFHVGLDEVWDMGLCELCRPRVERDGLGGIFREHVLHSHALLKSLGKTMLMWDDLFESFPDVIEQIPRDIVMCTWYYGYIDRYPDGHFNNRRREDVFAKYDRLGIRYLASTNVRVTNVESFTAYADRYRPLGMFATLWEQERMPLTTFHILVAQAGLLWQGVEPDNPPARLAKAVKLVCGDVSDAFAETCAQALIFEAPVPSLADAVRSLEMPHADTLQKTAWRTYLAGRLGETSPKTAVNDHAAGSLYADALRYTLALPSLSARIHTLAVRLFDLRTGERGCDTDALLRDLNDCAAQIQDLRADVLSLWERCREGLPHPALDAQYDALARTADALIAAARSAQFAEAGRLDLRFFLPDQHGAAFTRVDVAYTDGSRATLAESCFKSYNLDVPYFTRAFLLPCGKTPASVTLSVRGYGGCGFSYVEARTSDGVRCLPCAISQADGRVEHPAWLLIDDTRPCYLGEPDVQRAILYPGVSVEESSVTVRLQAE
ncbi:MAG: family 20 glycosylhydrolase [Clostridiales bacterium]|nr:family 20 glycosylhydrolase [Clostridiales bacterium]